MLHWNLNSTGRRILVKVCSDPGMTCARPDSFRRQRQLTASVPQPRELFSLQDKPELSFRLVDAGHALVQIGHAAPNISRQCA